MKNEIVFFAIGILLGVGGAVGYLRQPDCSNAKSVFSPLMQYEVYQEWNNHIFDEVMAHAPHVPPKDFDYGEHWMMLSFPVREYMDDYYLKDLKKNKPSPAISKTYDLGHLQPFEGGKL